MGSFGKTQIEETLFGTVPSVQPPIARVLIVGAGIAGLGAARALQKQGIAFDIIDAQSEIGGVWASGYEGLKAQGEPKHPQESGLLTGVRSPKREVLTI